MSRPISLLAQLAIVGDTIHGDGWPRAIALDLGPYHPLGARGQIDDRLVRRWISGDRPVPAWIGDALPRILASARLAAVNRMDDAASRLGYDVLGGDACMLPSVAAKKQTS